MWDGDIIEHEGIKYELKMSFLSTQKGIVSVHLLVTKDTKEDNKYRTLYSHTNGTDEVKVRDLFKRSYK